MIQPEDIRRKAENLYGEFVRAWLAGDSSFFPRVIPSQRDPDPDLATAIGAVRALRDASKEVVGFGYTVEWREINSRRFGRNLFPARIIIETQDDYLRLTGRARSFRQFQEAVERHPRPAQRTGGMDSIQRCHADGPGAGGRRPAGGCGCATASAAPWLLRPRTAGSGGHEVHRAAPESAAAMARPSLAAPRHSGG